MPAGRTSNHSLLTLLEEVSYHTTLQLAHDQQRSGTITPCIVLNRPERLLTKRSFEGGLRWPTTCAITILQSRVVLSSPADARMSPLLLKTRAVIRPECPLWRITSAMVSSAGWGARLAGVSTHCALPCADRCEHHSTQRCEDEFSSDCPRDGCRGMKECEQTYLPGDDPGNRCLSFIAPALSSTRAHSVMAWLSSIRESFKGPFHPTFSRVTDAMRVGSIGTNLIESRFGPATLASISAGCLRSRLVSAIDNLPFPSFAATAITSASGGRWEAGNGFPLLTEICLNMI